ncbi:carbohydrate kinase family protein [Curtobacterium sp. SL109]|uniref:carbohydrate kinase family protein n=1 Tax=Curtobacterium sp. SL109 TaxID=2994662 RepID=UPI002275E471|nr:carbohydrate kinase family protein [Curtobacterium sp. SL109]MCY1693731.1 carbohydrate kinase family protein [Curtobacterium sp. SL109]
MTDGSLLCIGNLTIDDLVVDGTTTTALGGDALFAALAARRVLTDVRMLAPVGTDLPAPLLQAVAGTGIRIEATRPRDGATIRNRITYAADGSRVWDLLSGEDAFDTMSVYPEDVAAEALDVDGVLVSAMSLRSQLALGPWLREQTAHDHTVVYLDLQEDYVLGNERALLDLLPTCDVFLPSEVEAVALAGTADLTLAAARFRDAGADVVVIKTAERGCVVPTSRGTVVVPTVAVEPVDSTGAGDAFCGAFAAAHVAGADPEDASRHGAEAARVAISGHGVAPLLAEHGITTSFVAAGGQR